jgi:hypothetical protein
VVSGRSILLAGSEVVGRFRSMPKFTVATPTGEIGEMDEDDARKFVHAEIWKNTGDSSTSWPGGALDNLIAEAEQKGEALIRFTDMHDKPTWIRLRASRNV